jgi:O-antigen/teichoic acid export membrane protein
LNNSGLKKRFIRSVRWTVVGHGLSQLIRLGSSLILTRILAPDLYGVMAVGYVVITGIGMFSDLGLSSGAIRSRRGEDPQFLNVSWLVQIARGVLIALGAVAVAAALALAAGSGWLPPQSVYADPRVPPMLAVVSIYGIVSSFESTKVWSARRDLSLAAITKIELFTQLATTAFQLVWAWVAPSIWTLAGGWIFGGALKTLLTHVALPGSPNRFEWDPSVFREILGFGKWVILSSALSFLLTSGDKLLLGGLLDANAMGSYSIAFMLIGAVQVAVLKVVGSTVLPALSEVHRERSGEMRATFYKIRWPLDVVCLVSAGALVMLGDPIVNILYDSRYAAAGWMLAALALTLVSTRLDVLDQCLIATGRVRLLSMMNGVRLITLYCAVPLGYRLAGAHGAVAAVAASSLFNALMMLTMQARLGLLDKRRELIAIPLFVGGMVVGWAAKALLLLVR